RTAMSATGNHENTPWFTSTAMAASTTTLSASGSRNAPDRVLPWRLASHPSSPSVQEITNQKPTVGQFAPCEAIITMRTGMANTRASVTALAGVSSADGPNASAAVVRLSTGPP